MTSTRKISSAKMVEARLNQIIQAAIEQGASEAVILPVHHIVVDERVRIKCQVPLCDSYNRNLMCPPNLPSVSDFRVTLNRYSQAILIQIAASLQKTASASNRDVFLPAKKLHDLINNLEKMAFENGFTFATGLIGGCCRLCDECVAVTTEKRCRHPFKARPSMEAMGIDVTATLDNSALATLAFPVSDSVRWNGLLLL